MLSHINMPFNFIFVLKNACSSVKISLLNKFTTSQRQAITLNPHGLANSMLKGDLDFDKPFISLVRNPFSRFISAFADKCGPSGDQSVWLPLKDTDLIIRPWCQWIRCWMHYLPTNLI